MCPLCCARAGACASVAWRVEALSPPALRELLHVGVRIAQEGPDALERAEAVLDVAVTQSPSLPAVHDDHPADGVDTGFGGSLPVRHCRVQRDGGADVSYMALASRFESHAVEIGSGVPHRARDEHLAP